MLSSLPRGIGARSSQGMPQLRFSPRVRLQAISIFVATGVAFAFSQFSRSALESERVPQDWITAATAQPADPDLVLLALDENSLAVKNAGLEPHELSESPALQMMAAGFPWSREVYALAVDQLMAAGARLVIFDLVFPSPREGDEAFAAALERAGDKVVLASQFDQVESVQGVSAWSLIHPVTILMGGPLGFVNLEPSNDSVIRHFAPYATDMSMKGAGWGFGDEAPIPALSTAAALKLGYSIPVPAQPELRRFPYLQPGTLKKPPLYEIFVPALWEGPNFRNGEYFRDKIVLIGPTAARLQDNHKTPFGVELPGPEIHLSILSALRHDTWLYTAPKWAYPACLLLSAFSVFLLAAGRRNTMDFVWGCLLLCLFWTALFVAAFLLFDWFVPVTHPLGALVLCGFAALASDVSFERRERRRMRQTLARHVSEDFVREMVDDPDSYTRAVKGERREVVVLFCDLKGFTSASEVMDATRMVELLNEYFAEMVDAILARRGILDKFIGDALMVTWGNFGTPDPQADIHHALAAAAEMRRRLIELNLRRREANLPEWDSGIGITFGPAISGIIGSEQKSDFTVIGDTVNLASRLEGLTRIYGCHTIVEENAASLANLPMLRIDTVRVKGRRAATGLYFPLSDVDRQWIDLFEAGRADYLAGRLELAMTSFSQLAGGPLSGLAQCYLARCETFLTSPPAADWDGTWIFGEK